MKSLESDAFYQPLFENMFEGLAYCQMLFDSAGQPIDFIYLRVNRNFGSLTGLKDVEGKRVSVVIPGILNSNPELFEIYGRVALTGKPERFETGIESLRRSFAVAVYSPKRGFFVATFQNITGRKLVEKNLADAKIAARNVLEDLSLEKSKMEIARAKEEAILLSIGDGLLATDESGNITLFNNAAEVLLGQKRGAVMGRSFSEMIVMENEKGVAIPLAARPMTMALTTGAVTKSTTAGASYYYVRPDKTKFPMAIMVTPVILDDKVIGAIEVFRDITKEKEIDRAKSEFVSLASHQLRTPTTAVTWYSEMLLGEEVGVLNVKQKEYMQAINYGNSRMIDLVNSLLSVSRIELGTFAIAPAPTDLIALAEDVLKELQTQIADKRLVIERGYSNSVPIIQSDPKLVRIIFQNLLTNAVGYTRPKGRIALTIKKVGGKLVIAVADNGYGIPAGAQASIYTKFFRADNARAVKPDGTGLGLYITKSIVAALGGGMSFQSRENEGSTFTVTL